MRDADVQVQMEEVQANAEDTKLVLKTDAVFFMNFFMGEKLVFPIPPFHIDIFNRMISSSVSKIALAIPRGHNKTTLAKLAVVHYFLFTEYSFIVYVSNTAEVAQAACRDIAAFLTSKNCVNVFGELDIKLWREGEGLYQFNLNGKDCVLRALGAGQQIRGINVDNRRPELGVVDDLEDDENTATPPLRQKLLNWVYGAFIKAFNKWKIKLIWLGNMLSDKSILKAHCDDPEWDSIRLGCILSNGQPLWPDLWPLEEIRKDLASYKRRGLVSRWFAEMMNLPMPEGGAVINVDQIMYMPACVPGDIEFGFITLDPALGKDAVHDFSGICVHGYNEGRWQIVEHVKTKVDPKQSFDLIMELCRKWQIKVVGIESVAFQAVLEFFFTYLLMQLPENDIEIVKLTSFQTKTARIQTWCSLLKQGSECQYALTDSEFELTQQLINYDPSKKDNEDDLIDSAAHGVQMINEYSNMIMRPLREQDNHAEDSYAICAI